MTTGSAGTTTETDLAALAREVACRVTDPEMPMLTLEDLGVLRHVEAADERVVVTITPTYSGCPAMATMRDDLVRRLRDDGLEAEVRVALSPAWSATSRVRTSPGLRGSGNPAARTRRSTGR